VSLVTNPIVHVQRLRKARGVSQKELARQAGISRQSLVAVEAGRQNPSTLVALGLARALGCTVEDLFELPAPEELAVRLDPSSPTCARVAVGRVGGRWVAHGVDPSRYDGADAVIVSSSEGSALARPSGGGRGLEHNVLIGGCAPILATLDGHVGERAAVRWVRSGSGRALELLADGLVHMAGVHYPDGGNLAALRARFPSQRLLMVNLVSWKQGLVVAPGHSFCVADLARPGLRVAWREEGAGARTLMLDALAQAGVVDNPAGPVCGGHLDVARAVAAGAADVGVSIEAAAAAFGLPFVPLSEERFDLCVPEAMQRLEAVRRTLDGLDSRGFRAEAAAFGGYGVAVTGHAVEVGP
jgi:putative molybdopterin biosynthesis protein